ncbi:hypothetical protein [Arenimonas composti]|uniref:Uncharacterized protein n=1 Tax=Arenimonas composti TR7-09 = DSM 18010 TaxID=1121013 RepID=A0A091BWL8_9GAMM|nr:hypothetical protein [Arenimonas composti]KFN48740.1 hypothetical protein P873_13870 [Arenimonas composti TR7-09 = DSM 18010]
MPTSRIRTALIAGLLAAASLVPAHAGEPERPFIERSLVLAPARVAGWRLTKAQDFEGRPELGVGFSYRHGDHPDVLVSVFVYPHGRQEGVDVVGQLALAMRRELEDVAAGGTYEDLVFGEETDFHVVTPVKQAEAANEAANDAGNDAGNDAVEPRDGAESGDIAIAAIEEVEAELAVNDPDRGRRQPVTMTRAGEPILSVSYLFHRQLYAFKLRISARQEHIDAATFAAFADMAVHAIAPLIDVRNTGGCASATIHVDGSAGEASEGFADFVRQLARAKARGEREGCAPTLDTAVPAGFEGIELDVSGLWGRR